MNDDEEGTGQNASNASENSPSYLDTLQNQLTKAIEAV
jgi:hypothetical protein